MLEDVATPENPSASPKNLRFRAGLPLVLGLVAVVCSPLLVIGCNRSAGAATTAPNPQEVESARQQMELIPPPSKSRYMEIHSLTSWENPYITVQENMATLHITLADANPSTVGTGGMLRPVAARRQDVSIRAKDLPAALNAIPENSWPYGRVVAIEEAHNVPAAERPAVRRNVEATIRTLNDLGVVVYEWNENAGPR